MTRGVKGTARCGTPSGYNRHQGDAEDPCDACAAAKRRYDERRRAAPEQARKNRLKARAQGRAETRLRQAHLEEYRRYYLEAKADVEAEAAREDADL